MKILIIVILALMFVGCEKTTFTFKCIDGITYVERYHESFVKQSTDVVKPINRTHDNFVKGSDGKPFRCVMPKDKK